MLPIITHLLDFLFPPRQSEILLRGLQWESFRAKITASEKHNHVYLLPYNDTEVRAVIAENKFHHNPAAAKLLSKVLLQWVNSLPSDTSLLLLPIPLSAQRQKERGYNQVSEILTSLPNKIVTRQWLSRPVDTAPQTSLQKVDRLKNIIGAFKLERPEQVAALSNTTVVLVDDVTTTGSTLAVAKSVITPHLPSDCRLITLALAH